MRSGDEASVLDRYLRGQGNVVILAMNPQHPVNTYIALTRQRELARQTVRREEGLGIQRTFQNLSMHTAVAIIIACIPTQHVDHNLSVLTSPGGSADKSAGKRPFFGPFTVSEVYKKLNFNQLSGGS
jgi:hypothetical protein